jgi:hypothetical protein
VTGRATSTLQGVPRDFNIRSVFRALFLRAMLPTDFRQAIASESPGGYGLEVRDLRLDSRRLMERYFDSGPFRTAGAVASVFVR